MDFYEFIVANHKTVERGYDTTMLDHAIAWLEHHSVNANQDFQIAELVIQCILTRGYCCMLQYADARYNEKIWSKLRNIGTYRYADYHRYLVSQRPIN